MLVDVVEVINRPVEDVDGVVSGAKLCGCGSCWKAWEILPSMKFPNPTVSYLFAKAFLCGDISPMSAKDLMSLSLVYLGTQHTISVFYIFEHPGL